MEQKNELVISFNQIKFIADNEKKAQVYEERFYETIKVFQKNPLIQFFAMGVYDKLIDLSEYIHKKDYSQLLFDELDKVFTSFEELQNNPKLNELQKIILDTIKICNEKGIKI